MDRADIVHQNFLKRIASGELPGNACNHVSDEAASPELLAEIFQSQILSRQLDRVSRQLQKRGEGFYTIGSSGHEGSAAVAAMLRPTDMAFLHYRDAAFQIQRARQVPGQTPLWNMLLSFVCSAEDPISGGRHKVLGSKKLCIPPQTSTIASHLPKAVGAAFSVGLAKRLKPEHQQLPDDALIYCSFGDASLNHSTAQGAINTASWTAYQQLALPLLFMCEDNGIGISTRTPDGWVEATMGSKPGLRYFACDGLNMNDTASVSERAAAWVRKYRKPAFLHMRCVRLYGHAGADAQIAYMSQQQIDADEADDPLLHSARILIDAGVMNSNEVIDMYESIGQRVQRAAEQVISRPKLSTSNEVMASLIPPQRHCATREIDQAARQRVFGSADLRTMTQPQHMAKLINFALTDLMLQYPEIVLAGEDVGPKGGVYGLTQKLHNRFGAARVINTLLDEQSILGLGIGLAHNGILPIVEIQFLAYLHNAEDQLRGEAATLSFFSNGQYTNPMIIRIPGLGYQRGFGGHFHNDNSLAVLRDIPGIVIACPSNGEDAARMLRECVRLCREEQRIVAFIEPIALYMTKDLHASDDGQWSGLYPSPHDDATIALNEIGQRGDGKTLAIVSYGNGYFLSRQAGKTLRETHGIALRMIDLRWLAPLPEIALLAAVADCDNILIVDECRRTGSQSEALMALFAEQLSGAQRFSRINGEDSFIPTGRAFGATLPSANSIVKAALVLTGRAGAAELSA
jgi:2-oxoisovalerate dehydrogenase E1 component